MNETLQFTAPPDATTLARVLPGYIAAQRWFGGKSRGIRSVRLAYSAPLPRGTHTLCLWEVTHNDGSSSLYQLPIAESSAVEAQTIRVQSPHAVIATMDDGRILYDATASVDFRAALLDAIVHPQLESAAGIAASHSSSDLAALDSQPSRVNSAEQSNTSIRYGDQAILKLYRLVQRGENPDVEVPRFLTNIGHFHSTPAYLGDLHLAADGSTLAFLQAFAPNRGDGWEWTLAELSRFYADVAEVAAPSDAEDTELLQHAGSYLSASKLLGRRTAEMHIALATPAADPAFSVEQFTAKDIESLRSDIGSQANAALHSLKTALPNLPVESRSMATQLLDQRSQLLELANGLSGNPAAFGARIRIHGDYHLGQLLRSDDDFLIIDFEGEPARPLAERRRKHSPLKDVAGMLRSFSYAARAALPASASSLLQTWASLWETAVSKAFLLGYRESIGRHTDLLPQVEHAQSLLLAFLLEKAVYELLYELNNRPSWLPLPLSGLLMLANLNVPALIS